MPAGVAGAGTVAADRTIQLTSLRYASTTNISVKTITAVCELTSQLHTHPSHIHIPVTHSSHTVVTSPVRSVGYEPPRQEHLDAVLVLVRHLTTTSHGSASVQPAQRQQPWIPTTPVVLAVTPTRRSPAPPRLGPAGQPAYQHVAQRVYRMLRRGSRLWPTADAPVTPLVGMWLTAAAPWREPKVGIRGRRCTCCAATSACNRRSSWFGGSQILLGVRCVSKSTTCLTSCTCPRRGTQEALH